MLKWKIDTCNCETWFLSFKQLVGRHDFSFLILNSDLSLKWLVWAVHVETRRISLNPLLILFSNISHWLSDFTWKEKPFFSCVFITPGINLNNLNPSLPIT